MKTYKKVSKRILTIFIAIVVLCILVLGAFFLFVPISRSDKSVSNYVLKQVPIGTSWDKAIEIIEKEDWVITQTNAKCGLRINDAAGNVSFASEEETINGNETTYNSGIVGTKAMMVELGEFYGPFHTAVFAYLAFDENDELIEVAIKRDIDSF